MKFSEFCQKNAVSVALLASIIALGFIAWNMMCPKKDIAYVQTGRHYDYRHRFFERYRMPRYSEDYKEKYRQLVNLLQQQTQLSEEAYKHGTMPVAQLMEEQQKFVMAKIALARMESDSRISLGAIEAMAEIQFLKRILDAQEQTYKAGALNLNDLNRTKIALIEAELKLLEKERILRRNQEFAKLAAEFDWNKYDDVALKALIEAEGTIPERGPHREQSQPDPKPEQ